MTLQDMLEARALPAVNFPSTATGWWRRHMELQQLLCREAYGRLPPPPQQLSVREVAVDERFCAGNNCITFNLLRYGKKCLWKIVTK